MNDTADNIRHIMNVGFSYEWVSGKKGMVYMTERKDPFADAAEILCDEVRSAALALPAGKRSAIQEIRLRAEKPLCFSDGTSSLFTDSSGRILYSPGENAFRVTRRQVYDTFRRLCSYSVHSCQNEIRSGFITIKGGHRAGICGTAVMEEGRLSTVTDISSINIRIARQVFGAAEKLMQKIFPFQGGVLLIGAPASGKTTLLRDLARSLSLGIGCRMQRTSVIDERGELAGTYEGVAYNDLGLCDVFNGYPKGEGILQAVRAMSPQVIICDELGSSEDVRLAEQGFHAGAVMIASLHAPDFESLLQRKQAQQILETGAFRTAVLLSSSDRPGEISQIMDIRERGCLS